MTDWLVAEVWWLALTFTSSDLDGHICAGCGKRNAVQAWEEDGRPFHLCPWCLADDGAFRVTKVEPQPCSHRPGDGGYRAHEAMPARPHTRTVKGGGSFRP